MWSVPRTRNFPEAVKGDRCLNLDYLDKKTNHFMMAVELVELDLICNEFCKNIEGNFNFKRSSHTIQWMTSIFCCTFPHSAVIVCWTAIPLLLSFFKNNLFIQLQEIEGKRWGKKRKPKPKPKIWVPSIQCNPLITFFSHFHSLLLAD